MDISLQNLDRKWSFEMLNKMKTLEHYFQLRTKAGRKPIEATI